MTDSEWQSASEPHAMLESLQRSGRPSARKLRLFAVACSRRMWDWIDTPGRMAVEVAERFADGSAGPEELRAARLACQGAGSQAAWYAAATNPAIAARNAARSAQAGAANHPLVGSEVDELLAQAQLLREIFGNRLPHSSAEPSWLTPSVVTMAQAIYDQRAFDRLPEIACVLEDAGCANQEIFGHCRGPGPHYRGCWVVDTLLGRCS